MESVPSNSDDHTFSNWSYEFKWRLGIRSKKLELDQEVRKCREQRERRRFTGGPYPASSQRQPRRLEDRKRQAGLKRYFAIRLGLVHKIDPRLVRLKSKERRGTRRGPRLNLRTPINRQRFCSTVYCATFSARLRQSKQRVAARKAR